MTKLTGIKKAAGIMKNSKYSRAYMNISTGEVWANEYSDANSWTRYDDEDIEALRTWIGFAANELGENASWTAILTWAAKACMNNRYDHQVI